MKRTTLSLVLLPAAAAAHAQTDPYQLRGFSTATVFGDHGVLAMTRECQITFGDVGAVRMCTSSEILATVTVPQGLSGKAWVRPDYEGFAYRGRGGSYGMLDASGELRLNSTMSCLGWNQKGSGPTKGLTVNSVGGFTALRCDVGRPVACCEPFPIPEPPTSIAPGHRESRRWLCWRR